MLYILWGEDDLSREEKLQEIKSSLGEISLIATNTSVLEGQKLSLNDLKANGEATPFLSSHRLVIIKGLLERFEAKEKSARPKKNSGSKQDEAQVLADCIKNFPDSTVLVITDNIEVKSNSLKNNPLFNTLQGKAQVLSYPMMKGIKLNQWVQARVTRQGGSISRQAVDILIELIGGDLRTMANEISKLAAFTAGRMIEEKDVRMVVSAAREGDIFALVDAIMDRKAGLAEQLLQKVLQYGVAPPQVLVLLARQIQQLVQIKDLKSQRRPAAEIQARLGVFNPYVWNRIASRAEKFSPAQLREIYRKLLETDLAIKTGKFDGDLALNILIAELCDGKDSGVFL